MINPNHLENLEPDLLRNILEPLFDDFLHWFGRTQKILESGPLDFINQADQAELLQKVTSAIQAVMAAQALFNATDGKAGVDTKVVMEWHQLVTQCWKVLIQASKSET